MDDPSLLDSFDDLDFFGNLGLLADGPTFLDKLDSKVSCRGPGAGCLAWDVVITPENESWQPE